MRVLAPIFLALSTACVASSFTLPSTSFIRGNSVTTTKFASSSSALCMKTIAVIGASGLTAQECVYQALKDGDKVVGLTRNPSKLVIPKGSGGSKADQPFDDPNLTCIAGSVTNPADVAKVFENDIDGVIIALGGKTSDVGDTMLTDGTVNIINAMKEKGVKRLAVVTSIGAGDSKDQAPFFFKILMATAMKKIFNDKNNQEKAVEASGLDYCIVRPGGLTVDAPTGVINVIDGEAGSISRADVATFCLDAITVDDFPYIGKTPCISSVGGTSWVKDRSKAARGETEM
uniref:NAD(P)-binding domain-containing protein n=1 Tax=Helicotheca tamesis TaxID=374047 RepID=A0A6U0FCZ5_9STRA